MADREISLNDELKKELISTSIDMTQDYLEIAIDAFLKEGPFKEIPIVGTLYSTYKIANTIRDAHFMKKLLVFLKEYNSGTIKEEKLEKFKKKITEDAKFKEKVTEHVILILDRFDASYKAKLLGNLFTAYINDEINWETFQFLSSCINSLMSVDFEVLKQLYKSREGKDSNSVKVYHTEKMIINSSFERLISYGLLEDDRKAGSIIKAPEKTKYKTSELGNKLYHHCFIKHKKESMEIAENS